MTEKQIVYKKTSELKLHPNHPRGFFEELEELGETMVQKNERGEIRGVEDPIHINEMNEILEGGRRWKAASLMKIETLPCILHSNISDQDRLILQCLSDAQKNSLRPMEKAKLWEELRLNLVTKLNPSEKGRPNAGQGELAKLLGVSPATVSNTLSLLGLPSDLQTELSSEKISMADALIISREKELTSNEKAKITQHYIKNKKGEGQRLRDAINKKKQEKILSGMIKLKDIPDEWIREQFDKKLDAVRDKLSFIDGNLSAFRSAQRQIIETTLLEHIERVNLTIGKIQEMKKTAT